MRRLILVAVVVMTVLAGCTTASDPGGAAGGDGTDATTTAASGGSDTGDADDGGDASAGSWDRFEFREGEYYEYEVYLEDEYDGGTLTWEVLDVSGDEVTVKTTFEAGDASASQTVTAPADEVYGRLMMPPFGTFVLLGVASPFAAFVEDEKLAVGEGWSYAGPDGSGSFRVDRVETHAGLECSVVELTSNETVVYETCVTGDAAMPGHVAVREEATGEASLEMTLVEYHAGN